MFSVHTKTNSLRFQIPTIWKACLEMLCFCDGLVWTAGKLRGRCPRPYSFLSFVFLSSCIFFLIKCWYVTFHEIIYAKRFFTGTHENQSVRALETSLQRSDKRKAGTEPR